jgi:hypothetical protein
MSIRKSKITSNSRPITSARVLGPRDGETLGTPGIMHDRFMISGRDSGGGFALVEHLLPP